MTFIQFVYDMEGSHMTFIQCVYDMEGSHMTFIQCVYDMEGSHMTFIQFVYDMEGSHMTFIQFVYDMEGSHMTSSAVNTRCWPRSWSDRGLSTQTGSAGPAMIKTGFGLCRCLQLMMSTLFMLLALCFASRQDVL